MMVIKATLNGTAISISGIYWPTILSAVSHIWVRCCSKLVLALYKANVPFQHISIHKVTLTSCPDTYINRLGFSGVIIDKLFERNM